MTESQTETPVLDLLASMTADSLAASSLDAEELMLVRSPRWSRSTPHQSRTSST